MSDERSILGEWRQRGFEGGVWADPPSQDWPGTARNSQERIGNVHDVDELFMVVAGQVELALGSAVLRPAVGEEVLIPAGMRHTVRNVGTGPARWLYAYRVVS